MCFAITADLSSCELVPNSSKHKHTYGDAWSNDGTHHWYTCTDTKCDSVSNKAEHTYESNKCSVCGFEKTAEKPEEKPAPTPSLSENEVTEAQFNAALNFNNVQNITIKFDSNAPDATTNTTMYFDGSKIMIDFENNTLIDDTYLPDAIYEISESTPYAYVYFPKEMGLPYFGWVRSPLNLTDEYLTEASNSINELQSLFNGITLDSCTYTDGYYIFTKQNYEPLGTDLTIKLRFKNSKLVSVRGEYMLDGVAVYELQELSNRGTTAVTIPTEYRDISEITPEPSTNWASYFVFDNVTAGLTTTWKYAAYPEFNSTETESMKINGNAWLLVAENYFKIYYDGTTLHKENTTVDDEQLYLNGSTWFQSVMMFSVYESLFTETSDVYFTEEITMPEAGVTYNNVKITITNDKISSVEYTLSVNTSEIVCDVTYKYEFSNWGTTVVEALS